ncbi:hypothetical protein Lal_00031883 [Lupinus albus]|nr:hypothetical protein Lal_00031883 [Lupinus albus]
MTTTSSSDANFNTNTPLWYPNSRATNHLTHDHALVQQLIENFTSKHIYMGNGSGIPIATCADSNLHSFIKSNET